MTKIRWLQFLVSLLALGKIPFANFCICGTQCRCHAEGKIGHSRNPCNRSYKMGIVSMRENEQNSMVAVSFDFTSLRKNTFRQFLYMWYPMSLSCSGKNRTFQESL